MFADFVDFVARKMTNPGLNEADMLKAFAVFDTERKGLVSAQEMKGVLMKMGEMMTKKEIETIFKDADIDRNGMIKYKKFVSNLNELYEIFS
jgi:Ca2+-binding EF-hand superfamily protein